MEAPVVSVIVTAYNAESWLARCINSIISSTLRDIELILIDDGSTDGSLTIMKEYEGMTLSEYNALHNKKKDDDAIGRETNLQMDIAIRDRQAKIVSEAQKRHLSPSTENLRANRAAEKKARAQQMPIIPKEETVIETAAVQSLPKKGNGPILPVSASDALREFNEEEFDE